MTTDAAASPAPAATPRRGRGYVDRRNEREKAEMRSFRVRPSLWEAAKTAAHGKGENLSDVLTTALTDYVEANPVRRRRGGPASTT